MLPSWLTNLFLAVAGLLVVILLVRIVWRWWQSGLRGTQPRSDLRPLMEQEPVAVQPQPLPTRAMQAASVANTATTGKAAVAATVATGTTAASSLWGSARRRATELPQVLREDLPGADSTDRAFGALNPAFASLMPESDERKTELRSELQTAGYYNTHAAENFSAIRYVLVIGGLVLAGVALVLAPRSLEPYCVGAAIVLPLLGWALPRLYIRGKAAQRKNEIENGMPDLLDMLNMCVGQGLTVHDSLKRIVRDLRGVYPALAQELRIVLEQAQIGHLNLALANFSRRIDLPEVHSFTSLMTQTERMGTSVSDALTTYSDTMRDSLKQRADEKGNQAAFKLLFPTVLCLMPAVYLFLLGPAVVELSQFFYSGGRDALDTGSSVIQNINQNRQLPPQ